MAEYKGKKELIEQAIDYEAGIAKTIPPRPPSDAKYKRDRYAKDVNRPDLSVGMKLVVLLENEKGRAGYLGGIVLDWSSMSGFWTKATTIIIQVVAVSNENLFPYIGRLLPATTSKWFHRNYRVARLGSWKGYKMIGPR